MKFDFFGFGKKRIEITKINIMWKGSVHAIEGMDVKADTFEIEIPFSNKTPENMLTKHQHGDAVLKTQKTDPVNVERLEVAAPFKLVAAEPVPPIKIQPDQRVTFRLRIAAPSHGYSGPLNITMRSEVKGLTHIELARVVLKYKTKSVEIENSAKIIDVPKGQIFTQTVQLYKIINFKDRINDIEVNAPFELVSQEPNPPFVADNPNSCVVALYITVPEFNYAGPLEITLR